MWPFLEGVAALGRSFIGWLLLGLLLCVLAVPVLRLLGLYP
jgi:hypothetical protein